MKKFVVFIIAVGCIATFSSVAAFSPVAGAADKTATSTVYYVVSPINEILVSGSPTLTVNAATAGSEPNEVPDAITSTYSITTNETAKITAKLNTNMPGNITLKVNLAAPTGGTSLDDVTLSATAHDVVTGITPVAEINKTITYKLSATVLDGVVASTPRTVTFTLVSPNN